MNEVRRISRYSCQGFCSISRVGPQGLCVWSSSLKGSAGNTYMPLILSSRVAPDITDADVHALCTKPAVLKMKESGKSSRNHRTVRGRTETCRHQVNERSAWLPQRSMKVNWQPYVFHLHNKKEKKSVLCKSESVYHKI